MLTKKTQEIIIPLVDASGTVIGYEEKIKTHREGLLHLAFSVLVFNTDGQLLIHRRASNKYHSPMLWTNACCGHPLPNEKIIDAAGRRLNEEMGFSCALEHSFTFHYKASFSNGLTENEIDHVFLGYYNGAVIPDPDEVDTYAWKTLSDIKNGIHAAPENYTVWFKEIIERL